MRRPTHPRPITSAIGLELEPLEERTVPAPFTAGNVAVFRVGDGTAALGSGSTAVFVDEYTPTGTKVQSIPLPTAASGANQPLTASATSTSEGMLSLSGDGRYLVIPGYGVAPGTAGVTSSSTAVVPRVIGRIDAAAAVDTTTTTTAFDGANIRGAGSADGSGFWAVGNSNALLYTPYGGTGPGTTVSSIAAGTSMRAVSVVGGQLYVSTGSGSAFRVGTVGSGAPITGGQTITNLPGFVTSGSPYQFAFADLSAAVPGVDTLYVADDIAGQVQKYSLVGGNWVLNNAVTLSLARGITAAVTGTTAKLFVASSSASTAGNGTLYSLTDASGYNANITASPVTLASAATNTSFRGIALVPRVSITLSPASLPGGSQGASYSQTLTTTGGYGNDTFAVTSGSLPTGLSLSAAGVLSGTPTATGTFNFRVTATEGTFSGFRDYTVVIAAGASVTVSPASLPNPTLQTAFSQTLTAAGGTAPYTFAVSAGTLPTGLTLAADGTLAGTPTASGTFTFTARATDNAGSSGTRQYTLTVPLAVAPGNLPDGTRGVTYSQTLSASGGSTPYSFAVTTGTLPTGLNFSTAGVLSGTPTAANAFSFTVTATDGGGVTGSRAYSIVIAPSATVTGIVRTGASPANAASVGWTVSFSQALSGLTASNFTLSDLDDTITGESITSVTAVGGAPATSWTVTASTGTTGDGTLRLNVKDSAGASPTVINLPTAVTTADYAVDRTSPTVSIGAPSAAFAAGGPVTFTVTYSGADTITLAAGHVTLLRTGTADASVAVTGSGSTRTVTLSGVTGDGTLGISLAAGTASDAAGNFAPAAGPSTTFEVDNTPPKVLSVVRAGGPVVTNAGSVQYTVTFSEPVSGVSAGTFTPTVTGTLAGVTVSGVTGGPTTYTVTVNTGTGDGTLRLDVPAGAGVADAAGNGLAAAFTTGESFSVDRTAPAVTIGAPSVAITRGGPVTFTVTYADDNLADITFGVGDVTLVRNGTADATVGVTGTGSIRTVTLSGITGDGTLGISVASGTATDAAGNTAPAAGPSGIVQVDNTIPAVMSVVRTGTPPTTNAGSVRFDVTFSEAVSGVTTGSFTPVADGTLSGVVVTDVAGGPSVYTVTVDTGVGDGSVRLDVPASLSITDQAGNGLAGAFIGGETYTLDRIAPKVLSVIRSVASPTNAGSVAYSVTFSEAVTGAGIAAFGFTTTGLSGPAVTDVSGSGAIRTVTVSTGSGDGTLRLDVLARAGVTDAAGNGLAAGFSGETYAVDRSAPAVTGITRAGTSPINAATAVFTVTFGEPVTGVDATDFVLAAAGVSGASIVSVTPGPTVSNQTFTVTVDTGTGDGTIGLNLTDDDTVRDAAGNRLGGTGPGNGNFTGQTYGVDRTAPTIKSIVRTSGAKVFTNADSVLFTVTFSEDVSGVTADQFTPAGSLPGATVAGMEQVDGRTYTVTVNTGSGEGTVRLDLPAASAVADAAGNTLAAGFTAGESFTLDRTDPVVTLGTPSAQLTRGGPVTFTVTYVDTNPLGVTLSADDITLAATGTASAAVDVAGTGTTRTVTLTDITGDGTLAISLVPGTATDAAGNAAPAASSGSSVTVDNRAPAVVGVARADADPTNAATVTWTVTFDEEVVVPGTGGFTVTTTGTVAGAAVTAVTAVDARTYLVTVGTGTGDGTVRLNVVAAGGVEDYAGNPLAAGFPAGGTYTILKSAPTIGITTPAAGAVLGPAGYFGAVTGTAADSVGKSVASVSVAIRRASDGSFWTGSGWAGSGSLTAAVSGTSWSAPFPESALDTGDSYAVTSTAVDAAGDVALSAAVTFSWDASPPAAAVTLSSALFGPTTWDGSVGGTVADTGPAGVADVGVAVTRSSDGFSYDLASASWVEGAVTNAVTPSGGSWSLPLPAAQFDHGVTYTVTAAARDSAGNGQSPPAAAAFVFDAVAPTSTVADPANPFAGPNSWPIADQLGGPVADGGPAGVAAVAVRVVRSSDGFFWNGAAWQSEAADHTPSMSAGSWSYTLPAAALTDGQRYSVASTAKDAAGNVQAVSGKRSFTWDATAPDLSITAPAAGAIVGPAAFTGFAGAATDPGVSASGVATVSLTLTRRSDGFAWDGTAFVPGGPALAATRNGSAWSLAFDPADLTDGETYDLTATALDAAGNTAAVTTSFTFDTAGPSTMVVVPGSGATVTASTWTGLAGTATDSAAGVERVEYRVTTTGGLVWDGAAFTPAGGWFTATGTENWTAAFLFANFPADGGYRVEARGVDAVGNVGPVAAADFTVVLPTVTAIAPLNPAGPVTNTTGPVTWRVTFSDPVAGLTAANVTLRGTFAGVSAITSVTPVGGASPSAAWDVTAAAPAAGTGTLGLTFVSAGNLVPVVTTAVFAGATVTFDRVAPTVTVTNDAPGAVVRVGVPIRYTVTFADDTAIGPVGLTADDVQNAAAGAAPFAVSNFTAAGQGVFTFDVTPTGEGAFRLRLAAPAVTDAAGNPLGGPLLDSTTFTADGTAPAVVSVVPGGASPTHAAAVDYTVTFSEDVSGVDAADFAVLTTGGVNPGAVTVSPISETTYTVTVDTGTGDGTIRLAVLTDGTVRDAAGNPFAAGFTSAPVTIDKTAPTAVVALDPAQPPLTNAQPVRFVVTFSEPVTGFGPAAVALGGTAGGLAAATAAVTNLGDDRTFAVAVSGLTSSGSLTVTVVGGPIADAADNLFTAKATSPAVILDVTAPTAVSITRNFTSPTNAGAVTFRVRFSEAVTGLDADDFTLVTDGLLGVSIAGVTGGGTDWVITVGTGTGDGSLRLDLRPDATGVDLAGNPLPPGGLAGEVFAIDRTAPTAALTTPIPALRNTPVVSIAVIFDEPVTGLDLSAFTLTRDGTPLDLSAATLTGGGTRYTLGGLAGLTGLDGRYVLTLDAGRAAVTDAAGNPLPADASVAFTVDVTAPTVTITPADIGPTNADAVVFDVAFDETVTGVDTDPAGGFDFFAVTGTAPGATILSVTAGVAGVYTVAVATGTGEGTVGLTLAANTVITDRAGNPVAGLPAVSGFTVVDHIRPMVAITDADADGLVPVNVPVVFTVDVLDASGVGGDLTAADFSNAGTAGAAIGTVTRAAIPGGVRFTVPVTPTTGGTLLLRLNVGAAIADPAGNAPSLPTLADRALAVDAVAPTVTVARAPGQAAATNAQPVRFAVAFSEPVVGFDKSKLLLAGAAGATLDVTGDGRDFVATVSGLTADGVVTLTVPAGVVTDVAGNPNAASADTDNAVTLDTAPPAVGGPVLDPGSDTAAADGITADATPTFTGTAEPGAAVTLYDDGTFLGATTATAAGGWAITAPLLADGSHTLLARASDAAGNVADSVPLTVIIDTTPPAVVVTRAPGQADAVLGTPDGVSVVFTVTASEPLGGLDPAALGVVGTAGGRVTGVSGGGSSYLVTVGGITRPGTVSLTVTAGVGTDVAGNLALAAPVGEAVAVRFETATGVTLPPGEPRAGDAVPVGVLVAHGADTAILGTVTVTLTGPAGTLTRTLSLPGPAADSLPGWSTPLRDTWGRAVVTFADLPAGVYTVAAAFSGSGGFLDSAAGTSFTVFPAPPVGQNSTGVFAAATGTTVTVFEPDGSVRASATPFSRDESPFGARVAVADVTGDGVPDLVAGTAPGTPAAVRVLDGATGAVVFSFPVFEGFTGGVFVAAGDLTGDGRSEIVVTPDMGGGPRVLVFDGRDGRPLASFLGIQDDSFRGGARVAVGDLNRDGVADLLVSAGFGGGPRVAGFDGTTVAGPAPRKLFDDFFLFDTALRDGAYVAVGDVDGDGYGDVIGGAGPGGAPRVLVLSGRTLVTAGAVVPLADFFAGPTDLRGGVRVAAKELDGDRRADLVTGSGDTGEVRVYPSAALLSPDPQPAFQTDIVPGLLPGVHVG